ncbi:MAG: DHH family phosphoesterase [Oscillospiraceae bacterium]|nr:DHH family phosphoesterase [Oscillospiraceae bacterium]
MNRKNWTLTPYFVIFSLLMFAMSFISVRYNPYLSMAEFGVSFASLIFVIVMNIKFRKYIRNIVKSVVRNTEGTEHIYLENFSFPVVVAGAQDDIVWCNSSFVIDICKGKDPVGNDISHFVLGKDLHRFIGGKPVKIRLGEKYYRVYGNAAGESTVLYYIDDTYYSNLEKEFNNKKASVAIALFDNADDFDTDSDGETQGEILLAVEKAIQKWATDTNSICCKISSKRYMLIFEERTLKRIIEDKFKILEDIRDIRLNGKSATISVGIGRGKDNLRESDFQARKALEMALGRGGDQVAISVNGEYEFFGGVSGGVERRSKVRTRTFAENIMGIIKSSDNVILMGHNFSDLDCVGASIGLYSTISKSIGKEACIACNINRSLAKQLIDDSINHGGLSNAFITPEEALKKINEDTLLIILDTHISSFLESEEIYQKCNKVIVIDHHRKMVDFIKDALVFFHEPTVSSTCEMVSELISYMGDDYLSSFEAEALLAGMMLDTKNFVIKTGVRTFEAAAYLKQKGADTVSVKRFFAGGIDEYRDKSKIVSMAKISGHNAIAFAEDDMNNIRIVSSQAADDLLGVEGVYASFVIYKIDPETTGISARSYGKVNVQRIMEELGGGGHLTMAACQIKITDKYEAEKMLLSAINKVGYVR